MFTCRLFSISESMKFGEYASNDVFCLFVYLLEKKSLHVNILPVLLHFHQENGLNSRHKGMGKKFINSYRDLRLKILPSAYGLLLNKEDGKQAYSRY